MDAVRNDGKLSDSEKAAMIAGLDRPAVVPFPSEKKWFLGYNTLEGILKTLNDRNYSSLPAQTAQQVVKQVTGDWNSYFKSLEAYKKNPELFTGRPGIVKYKKKGSLSSAVFTYQQCRVRENQNGKTYMKLPLTEHKLWVGKLPDGMRFVQAEIIPAHGVFEISLTFNVLKDSMAPPEKHGRIAGMDLGVDNLAVITDNIGSKPVIIKGGALKSLNRYVNKNVACLQSVLDGGTENGKELTASERKGIRKKIDRLWMKRESFMSDYFHKAAKQAVEHLKSSGIDTLVVGYNPG